MLTRDILGCSRHDGRCRQLKIAKLMGNSPAIAAKHYINRGPEEMADHVAF